MKWDWIQQNGSRRLILIFAGWSTTPSFYSHISRKGWDVAVVHDYTDSSFPSSHLDYYDSVAVFAWSMGVWAASIALPPFKPALAIAVNGTPCPVSNSCGIPVDVFDGTEKNLNPRNLIKFRKRMSGERYVALQQSFESSSSDIDSLKKQLRFIKESSISSRPLTQDLADIGWNRAIISTDDLIFPAANQQAAWQSHPSHPEIIEIEAPHYVDLLPVISGALPSIEKIASRFLKASVSYDREAHAQRLIAEKLISLCPDITANTVLEIGPGTGFLTRLIVSRLKPSTMHFVDLYSLPTFGVAKDEVYHECDAEGWVENEANICPSSFDAIVSASAIQWFVDPKRFFSNAAALLKPRGVLLCSTFLPGNMKELRQANPFGIVYRSVSEIKQHLSDNFDVIAMHSEDVSLSFSSSLQTLRHLSLTGVGGDSSGRVKPPGKSVQIPVCLTYRPLYIMAMRKP